jgi:hypothetical protein
MKTILSYLSTLAATTAVRTAAAGLALTTALFGLCSEASAKTYYPGYGWHYTGTMVSTLTHPKGYSYTTQWEVTVLAYDSGRLVIIPSRIGADGAVMVDTLYGLWNTENLIGGGKRRTLLQPSTLPNNPNTITKQAQPPSGSIGLGLSNLNLATRPPLATVQTFPLGQLTTIESRSNWSGGVEFKLVTTIIESGTQSTQKCTVWVR